MLKGALGILIAVLLAQNPAIAPADPDTDRDGLSDFREIHKHFTDPNRADSDGDGTPDGDWSERREYSYTVRSILRVLRRCSVEPANGRWICGLPASPASNVDIDTAERPSKPRTAHGRTT